MWFVVKTICLKIVFNKKYYWWNICFPDKPEVIALLDQTNIPFPRRPPQFIRSKLYKYHFTKSGQDTKDWWTRKEVGEYSPVFSKEDPPAVKNYLVQSGILSPLKKNQHPTNLILVKVLSFLRTQANTIPHHYLVWSVSWIVLPILFNIHWAYWYYLNTS